MASYFIDELTVLNLRDYAGDKQTDKTGRAGSPLPAERVGCQPAARTCRDWREHGGRSDAPCLTVCHLDNSKI
jgi:hypothetical protein